MEYTQNTVDLALLAVFFCFVLSFLFSASETALSSLGKLEIQTLVSKGGWQAKMLQVWIRDPHRALSTVLIGNAIANIVASSLLTLWFSRRFGEMGTTVWMLVFTVTFIIISEIVPKVIARQFAQAVAPSAMRFLQIVHLAIAPLVFIIHKASAAIVYWVGVRNTDISRHLFSEDDLSATIEIAAKEGGIDRETGEVLSNLIDFPDLLARDILTPRSKVQAISIAWSLEETMKFISQDGHSRFPVMRNSLDEIVGVILVKDLLAHIQRGSQGLWTRVVRRPYFVSELAPLGTILRDMKKWGTHLALVRNETGVLTGLITLEDLIEEIVGDIRDEHDDPGDAGGERAMGGPTLVSGEMPILDFNERYQSTLPMDVTYSTLNGYLLTRTGGQIPPVGTLIFGDEVTFRIHSVADSGIATIQVLDTSRHQSTDNPHS